MVRGDAKESDFPAAGAAVMGPGAGTVTVLHRENPAEERLSELKDKDGQIIQVEEERGHAFCK